MKSLYLALALLLIVGGASAQTQTPNLGLWQFPHNFPNYDVMANGIMQTLDNLFQVGTCGVDGIHALNYDATLKKFGCNAFSVSGVSLTPSIDQTITGAHRFILNNGGTGSLQGLFQLTGSGLGSVFGSTTLGDIVTNDGTSWALTVRNSLAGALGGLAVSVSNVGDVSVENGALQNGFLLQANGRVVLTSVGGASISLNANGGSVHVSNGPVLIDSLSINLPVCTDGSKDLITCTVATSQKAETTTADTSVLTVTPASTVGTYRACTVISVSSATAGVISWTLSWTDSNGNAQSNIAQDLFQQGTAVPATSFTTSAAGNYNGCTTFDVNNAGANIVAKWVGGGTTTAKMSATIERLQ